MSDEWDYNDRDVLTRTDDTLWRVASPSEIIAEIYRQQAEIERLRAAGVGYSQQTVDALQSELAAERKRVKKAVYMLDDMHLKHEFGGVLLQEISAIIAALEGHDIAAVEQ